MLLLDVNAHSSRRPLYLPTESLAVRRANHEGQSSVEQLPTTWRAARPSQRAPSWTNDRLDMATAAEQVAYSSSSGPRPHVPYRRPCSRPSAISQLQ